MCFPNVRQILNEWRDHSSTVFDCEIGVEVLNLGVSALHTDKKDQKRKINKLLSEFGTGLFLKN